MWWGEGEEEGERGQGRGTQRQGRSTNNEAVLLHRAAAVFLCTLGSEQQSEL